MELLFRARPDESHRPELAKYESWEEAMSNDFISHNLEISNAKSFSNIKREGVGQTTKGPRKRPGG